MNRTIHESRKETVVKQSNKAIELLESSGFRLRNLLFKMTLCENTADDLMQELFLKLAGSHGFGHCRNGFAYAWRTAVNLALDYHRKKRISKPLDERDTTSTVASDPVDKLADDEHIQIILNEISQMKPPGREILIMRHLGQQSFSEIADILEKKENHIRSIASKSLAKLRSRLNGQLDIEP